MTSYIRRETFSRMDARCTHCPAPVATYEHCADCELPVCDGCAEDGKHRCTAECWRCDASVTVDVSCEDAPEDWLCERHDTRWWRERMVLADYC